MLIIIFVILNIAILSSSGKNDNMQYTTVSYTVDGKPCINDCVDSKCVVDSDLIEHTCIYSNIPAPTYYTVMGEYKKPECLSRCGELSIDSGHDRCFVTNSERDYCTSDISSGKWISKISRSHSENESLLFEVNADHCELDGYSDMCIDAQGIVQESDKSYRSLSSDSFSCVGGYKCSGECKKISDGSYRCSTSTSYLCAPIAQPPPLNKIFKAYIPTDRCTNSINDQNMTKAIATTNSSNFILKAAENIQKSNYFTTLIFRDDRNPVHNCTVKPSANYGDPVLPLVIRAKITRETVRPYNSYMGEGTTPDIVTRNIERMLSLPTDVPGTLIGYELGGPAVMCNVVPVLPSLKEALKSYEVDIYKWVNEGACDQDGVEIKDASYQQEDSTDINSVYMTVVAIYGNTTRPSAIGIDIAYYKGDIEDKERTNVILCNQDPKQEAYVLNFFKRHCSTTKL